MEFDRDNWEKLLGLDEHPRNRLVVRTLLFRALWESKFKPNEKLLLSAPGLDRYGKVIQLCVNIAGLFTEDDIARLDIAQY